MSDTGFFDEVPLARLYKLGGKDLVAQMIQIFFKNGPERMEAARRGGETGDIEAVERAVHSLKSSAGNLGAVALQELAGTIEQQADERVWEGLPELLCELEEVYGRVEARLEEEMKGLEI